MRDLLSRYRRLAGVVEQAIQTLETQLSQAERGGGAPAEEAVERPTPPGLARVETPTGDLETLLAFQERLADIEGVLRVTVAGSRPGGSTFLVELAGGDGEEPEPQRVVCSRCGKVISEGREPASHGLCDDCRDKFTFER